MFRSLHTVVPFLFNVKWGLVNNNLPREFENTSLMCNFFIIFFVVLNFVKNLTCGGASWSISRLVPAPEQSST